MKIAKRELGEDSFLMWLVGSEYKRSNDTLPLLLKETAGIILDILPVHKLFKLIGGCSTDTFPELMFKLQDGVREKPLKVFKTLPNIATGMGQRIGWFVNQIPQIRSFEGEEESKKRKRAREAGAIVSAEADDGQEGNTVCKRLKPMEQEGIPGK